MPPVVPTPVGVNRLLIPSGEPLISGPHARGGEPENTRDFSRGMKWSPRPWG